MNTNNNLCAAELLQYSKKDHNYINLVGTLGGPQDVISRVICTIENIASIVYLDKIAYEAYAENPPVIWKYLLCLVIPKVGCSTKAWIRDIYLEPLISIEDQ